MTKRTGIRSAWAVLTMLGLAACAESGMDPLADGLDPSEAAELLVLEDAGALDAAVEFTNVTADVAHALGRPGAGSSHGLEMQARAKFERARDFLQEGDRRRALLEAREARRIAARAIVAAGGEEAVIALIEQLEELLFSIDVEDDQVFDDREALRARIEALLAEARALLESGNLVAAAERALLGEQLVRYHRGGLGHRGEVSAETARLMVSLARTAVSLADSLVADPGVPTRPLGVSDVRAHRNRWLVHARRMLERAETALGAGHYARAVHFAHHAHGSALKAVILPGGITQDELDAMVRLARTLLARAEAAVGDDPTELEARLLAVARRSIERGQAMLEAGYKRGVGPIWRGAVISRWLIA